VKYNFSEVANKNFGLVFAFVTFTRFYTICVWFVIYLFIFVIYSIFVYWNLGTWNLVWS